MKARGMTLVEVMISIAILAMISTMVWQAFSQTSETKRVIEEVQDRYHAGRLAMSRLANDLSNCYLTKNLPADRGRIDLPMSLFIGEDKPPFDRLDFQSFSHRRLYRNADESDEAEVSYFVASDPNDSRRDNLVRRESARMDEEPLQGGDHLVLLEDVTEFDVTYFDRPTVQWVEFWNTTEVQGQPDRLPEMVKIVLAFHDDADDPEHLARLVEKVSIPMTTPIQGRVQ
jgi:general secretion pathway protein J